MNFLHETFEDYDVEYYSLQKGDGEDEARKCSELIDVADQIQSFDDTIALIENFQQEDGSIKIPDVLVPYMGGQTIIKKN